MANTKVICNREDLVAIADAVRNKTGSYNEMTLADIADNVSRIQTSDSALTLEEKTVIITQNGDSSVTPSAGSALSKVDITVEVPIPDGYIKPNGQIEIKANGTHDVTNYKTAVIDVASKEPVLQDKTATPSTSQQVITADAQYDGLSQVTVDAIPNTYIEPTAIIGATEYMPSAVNQTIASGVYCSGVQTILGDSNLIAENIAEGVAIFGVVGTHSGGSGGSTEPDYRDLYQRVEYITSAEEDTYPYIITDFIADNSCGLEVVASFPVLQDRIPMGSRENSDATRFYCVYPMSASSVYYGFNTGSAVSCALKVNTVYRLQTNFLNSRLVCVYENNGTRKANVSLSATLTQQSAPVSIFGYHSASSNTVTSKIEYKLYSARCSSGHEIVREYIPCYRKSDGVVGLYEKITGQFLTSEIEAVFTKGADIEW